MFSKLSDFPHNNKLQKNAGEMSNNEKATTDFQPVFVLVIKLVFTNKLFMLISHQSRVSSALFSVQKATPCVCIKNTCFAFGSFTPRLCLSFSFPLFFLHKNFYYVHFTTIPFNSLYFNNTTRIL